MKPNVQIFPLVVMMNSSPMILTMKFNYSILDTVFVFFSITKKKQTLKNTVCVICVCACDIFFLLFFLSLRRVHVSLFFFCLFCASSYLFYLTLLYVVNIRVSHTSIKTNRKKKTKQTILYRIKKI
jgi:hypothetical protein